MAERNALGRLLRVRGPVSSTDLFVEFYGTPIVEVPGIHKYSFS
jgi:hypothetical protein